jgi:hypothetical protein
MKGRYKLAYDQSSDLIMFGNLGKHDEPEIYGIGTSNVEAICRTIAHDVVEHSAYHRIATQTSVEEEMRAIGASCFVRGYRNYDELIDLLSYRRNIKPVPKLIAEHIGVNYGNIFESKEEAQSMYNDDPKHITDKLITKISHQFYWGYLMKKWQFGDSETEARNTFDFIVDVSNYTVKELLTGHYSHAWVNFDTDSSYYKHRLIELW